MRKIIVLFAAAAMVMVAAPALPDDDMGGGSDAAGVAVANSLNPFFTTTQAGDYVAAGEGMRGSGSGTITIAGIPAGATVTNAFLYWAILGTAPAPASFANGAFDGNGIVGTAVGSGPDTCWGGVDSTFAYRADVTAYVPGNGSYSLSGFASGAGALNEGASLVVLYTDPAATEMRDIVIYDGADIIEFAVSSVSTNMTVPTVLGFGSAKTTYIVGDGQDIFSDDTLFNGIIIASDASGFGDTTSLEGSDGPLWDTDTYDVTSLINAGDTSITVGMQRGSDCLAHVAQVFSNSAELIVDIDIKPGSFPNSINTKSMGVVPVALLGSATFDVTDVDVTTLAFGPFGAAPAHDLTDALVYADHLQDVNGDGFTDLVSHYHQKETGLTSGDTEACLTGEATGIPFEGCDSVRVLH